MGQQNRVSERELNVPFADKEELVKAKATFNVCEYDERDSKFQGEARTESVFTIYLLYGKEAGYEQLITMAVTNSRRRLGKIVRRAGWAGPFTLEKLTKSAKTGKKLANPIFIFVPVKDAKVIAASDAMAERLKSEGIDRGTTDDDEDAED